MSSYAKRLTDSQLNLKHKPKTVDSCYLSDKYPNNHHDDDDGDEGLGIRHVISLALPAFVASAASTLSLQADILAYSAVSDSNFHHLYLTCWSAVW